VPRVRRFRTSRQCSRQLTWLRYLAFFRGPSLLCTGSRTTHSRHTAESSLLRLALLAVPEVQGPTCCILLFPPSVVLYAAAWVKQILAGHPTGFSLVSGFQHCSFALEIHHLLHKPTSPPTTIPLPIPRPTRLSLCHQYTYGSSTLLHSDLRCPYLRGGP